MADRQSDSSVYRCDFLYTYPLHFFHTDNPLARPYTRQTEKTEYATCPTETLWQGNANNTVTSNLNCTQENGRLRVEPIAMPQFPSYSAMESSVQGTLKSPQVL